MMIGIDIESDTGSPQTLYHYQPPCYILVLLRLYITTNHHATYWFSSDSISMMVGSDIESEENQYVA
jgi:hypothetical protein